MDVIAPGESFEYHYPNHQDAATLWYHDHAHGRTSHTLYYGLLAMYVLEDERERELELPTGDYDVPIAIADHSFNKDGSFRYVDNIDLGFRGDTILVNGAVSPRMRVDRRKYRFRLLNGSNSRSYMLRLGRGRRMVQIAADGGLLARPVARRRIPFHPAERIDLVIDFRDYRPGTELVLHNEDGEGGTVAVMRFDVGRGGGREEFRVPRRLRPQRAAAGARAPSGRWSLGFGARRVADRRRATSTTTGSTCGRATGPPSAGRSSTTPTACTRCTSTASCSACSSAAAGRCTRASGSAGRTRSACCRRRR